MKTKKIPHGIDVFNTHWNCLCKKCRPRRQAVKDLVESFSHIPSRWIEELAEKQGEFVPLPMWGTLFAPKESYDIRNIEKLLQDIESTDVETECFASTGWQDVADTGIIAIEIDDELLLGINGAGYDFYTHHWAKLYDALEYRWHE